MALDESDAIKGPKSIQTRAIIAVGKRAAMRRIATGTPVSDGPFDVFAQLRFLDPKILGISSFAAFKHEYGVFEKRYTSTHAYQHLLEYQRLEVLQRLITSCSHRVLKEDCFDLPPKVYKRIHVELGKEASALYAGTERALNIERRVRWLAASSLA